jgi:hypothetical protein
MCWPNYSRRIAPIPAGFPAVLDARALRRAPTFSQRRGGRTVLADYQTGRTVRVEVADGAPRVAVT